MAGMGLPGVPASSFPTLVGGPLALWMCVTILSQMLRWETSEQLLLAPPSCPRCLPCLPVVISWCTLLSLSGMARPHPAPSCSANTPVCCCCGLHLTPCSGKQPYAMNPSAATAVAGPTLQAEPNNGRPDHPAPCTQSSAQPSSLDLLLLMGSKKPIHQLTACCTSLGSLHSDSFTIHLLIHACGLHAPQRWINCWQRAQ